MEDIKGFRIAYKPMREQLIQIYRSKHNNEKS